MKKIRILDCAVIGFALFGMFFGAGNLIFPPYLGLESQANWIIGFICFLIMDVGLSVVVILSVGKNGEDATTLTNRLGVNVSKTLLIADIICLGPLVAVPRTAATSFEFSIEPYFGSEASWVFTFIFFAVAVALSIKQSQIITIIGAVLAPSMFLCLLVLIFKGAMMPVEDFGIVTDMSHVVSFGIESGYQTMDVVAAIIYASSVIGGVSQRGYTDRKQRFKATAAASVITLAALGTVYGGLCFLGSRVGQYYGTDISRTELLSAIVNNIMGDKGNIFLGVLVVCACLTAAIGILSSSAAFLTNITNGRLSYRKMLLAFAVISFFLSNLGVEKIMKMAVPVLTALCPVILTVTFLGFFNEKIKSDKVYKVSCLVALVINVISFFETTFGINLLVKYLPLSTIGFAWVIPTAIVAIALNISENRKYSQAIASK